MNIHIHIYIFICIWSVYDFCFHVLLRETLMWRHRLHKLSSLGSFEWAWPSRSGLELLHVNALHFRRWVKNCSWLKPLSYFQFCHSATPIVPRPCHAGPPAISLIDTSVCLRSLALVCELWRSPGHSVRVCVWGGAEARCSCTPLKRLTARGVSLSRPLPICPHWGLRMF